jgi:hypothetical protein
MIHCHICYSTSVEEDCVCDTCDEYYCSECSYTFTLHYQHEGARCHWCADQSRRKPLTKEMIRENKLKLIGL